MSNETVNANTADAAKRFAHLGMFFEAADAALFPLGRKVEVMAMGSWYRGVVVKPVTPKRKRLGVEYTSGSGNTRIKNVSLADVIVAGALGRGKASHQNPTIEVIGVRIPAALAELPVAEIAEAKAEKVDQKVVDPEAVYKVILESNQKRVAEAAYSRATDEGASPWESSDGVHGDKWRLCHLPATVAQFLDPRNERGWASHTITPKTHGASIRRELTKLVKAGRLRMERGGRSKLYSAVLSEASYEAQIAEVIAQTHIHRATEAEEAEFSKLDDKDNGRALFSDGWRERMRDSEALEKRVHEQGLVAASLAGKAHVVSCVGRRTTGARLQ